MSKSFRNGGILLSLGDISVGFDLDQHLRRDQSADLEHRRGWANAAKELTVRLGDFNCRRFGELMAKLLHDN